MATPNIEQFILFGMYIIPFLTKLKEDSEYTAMINEKVDSRSTKNGYF
jgi:hypothetical protein